MPKKKTRAREKKRTRKRKVSGIESRNSRRVKRNSADPEAGKILVSLGGARPLNVLDLRGGKKDSQVEEQNLVQRPRELTWRDYEAEADTARERMDANCESLPEAGYEGLSDLRMAVNEARVNFLDRANLTNKTNKTNFIINLLVDLPGDFIFFYKNKIKTLFSILQWSLEELGKAPFRIFFGFLGFLEVYVLKPITKLIFRATKSFCYEIFWIFRAGFWAIILFPKKTVLFLKPAPTRQWSRSVIAFVVVCLIIILPFGAYTHIIKLKDTEGKVLGVTAQAYEYLQAAQSATSELDFRQANEEFRRANENFILARNEIANLNFLIAGVINVLPKGAAAQRILIAGQAVAEAGVYLTAGLDGLSQGNEKPEIKSDGLDENEVNVDGVDDEDNLDVRDIALSGVDLEIGEKVRGLQENLARACPLVVLARDNLEKVDLEILPPENRENFLEIKNKILDLKGVCKRLLSFSKIIHELLAIDAAKRYLIVFQNENEQRPTGGFMGSFALLDVRNGMIEQLEVPGGGPYDLKNSLIKRVAPPRPLQLVNDQWQMQDANWFPDFGESAKKIIWFYENSGGPTVDGVIAITSGLVPELLRITGPIKLPEYDKVINKDNFYLETQLAVEVEYDREENRPKKFIADLTSRLIGELIKIPSDKVIDLLSVVDLAVTQKKMMFYFTNSEVQRIAVEHNWAGEVRKVGGKDDYLLVVNSNVGGGKTDGVITQRIIHETEILAKGELINTVTIIRTHEGGPGHFFANRRNVDYVRVYGPKGSVLLEAKGFTPIGQAYFRELASGLGEDEDLERIEGNVLVDEMTGTRITNEFGKTVFGNWVLLDPGETVIYKLRYRLPWVLDLKSESEPRPRDKVYTLLIQKQPGSKADKIEKMVFLPKGVDMSWRHPEGDFIGTHNGLVKFRSSLDRDKYYGVVFR